jgi:prepilin-type N-terminal cleavage/methylation domain-containing protein
MKKLASGFTMIELLIVIGVLGILAVGLLAAVDPFEQLKKARDTNNRQSAISLQTAFTRYYATHGGLPWDNTGVAGTCPLGTMFGSPRGATAVLVNDATMTDCITLLESDGELKTGFVNALGTAVSSTMYVNSGAPANVSVCFAPTSKAIFADSNTKFDSAGNDNTLAGTPSCRDADKVAGSQKVTDNPPSCFICAK